MCYWEARDHAASTNSGVCCNLKSIFLLYWLIWASISCICCLLTGMCTVLYSKAL